MNVIVLAGGLSSERNVSLSTGAKVCQALAELGHKAALVDLFLGLENYPRPYEQIFDAPPPRPPTGIGAHAPDLEAVKGSRADQSRRMFGPGVLEVCSAADVVFLGLHGACGEDGRVQAAFDLLGIPYTGSGYLGSAIAMDKDFTKRLVRAEGVLTPDWQYVSVTTDSLGELTAKLSLPCVVKVPTGGSSIGVTICRDRDALRDTLARHLGQRLLMEDYIEGREFSCGVLDNKPLPPIEIIPKVGFYDYQNKYQPGATTEVCPAEVTPAAARVMQDAALRVHRLLGLCAYSRSDFLMTKTGEVYFLEVNTLPGMTPTSLIPQEAAAVGVSYQQLCQRLLDLAQRERG